VNDLIVVLVILAAAAAVIAGGAALLPWLRNRRHAVPEQSGAGRYPLEAEIEAALIPFVFTGICAAYRVSEWATDEIGHRLAGLDKKAIADQIYTLLPDRIGRFDLTLVKRLVPRERFAVLVQDVFDGLTCHWTQFQSHYAAAFQEWVAEWKDGSQKLKVENLQLLTSKEE